MEIILRMVDGQLKIHAQVEDRVMALGMLEMAKSMIAAQITHRQAEAKPNLEVPSPAQTQAILNGRG